MSVEINIDLDSEKAHGKIQALRTDLETLGDDVDFDFGIDDDLQKSIQEITDELSEINIDVDYDDLERAAALKAMLEGDIETEIDFDSSEAIKDIEDGLDPPDPDTGDGGKARNTEQAKKFVREDKGLEGFLKKQKRMLSQPRDSRGGFESSNYVRKFLREQRAGGFSGVSVNLDDLETDIKSQTSVAKNLQSKLKDGGYRPDNTNLLDKDFGRVNRQHWFNQEATRRELPDFDPNLKAGKAQHFNLPFTKSNKLRSGIRGGRIFKGFKKKMKGLLPSMTAFYNVLAAILPMLVVIGAQALGVAAAMGSVAVAGGSILALGLAGHGEDMASSWKKAKEQLSTLKEEMFNTFQPTMQTFAPIQARFFDMMPEQLNKVATSMEGLTVFSDTLFASFAGLTDFIADFFDVMVANEGIISQVTMRFGELLGSSILDFFTFLITEAFESQEMLIRLGTAFKDVIVGVWHLFKVVAQVVAALKPLAAVFGWLGKLLDNKLIVGILTFAVVLGGVVYTVMTLTGVLSGLVAIWNIGLISVILESVAALEVWIFQTIAAQMANYGLAASIASVVSWATLGVGALLAMGAAASAIGSINASMERTTNLGTGGGGIPTSGGGGFGGGAGSGTTQKTINQGDTYNIQVEGDVDNATEEGMRDIATSETNITASRATPEPGGD